MDFTFGANNVYGVRVDYRNKYYGGVTDIDGCTLFATHGGGQVLSAAMIAYRPQHEDPDNNYRPFDKTAVTQNDEENADLGPGIRINGDDDDENETADRLDDGPVNDENDLIETLLLRGITTANFKLRRSNTKIKVWTTRTKGAMLAFPNAGGLETDNLPFGEDKKDLTVWVEWVDADHGTAELMLKEAGESATIDKVKFHTFHSIVIALVPQIAIEGTPRGRLA